MTVERHAEDRHVEPARGIATARADVTLRPVERSDVAFLHDLWRSTPALCGVRRPLGAVSERVLDGATQGEFLSMVVEDARHGLPLGHVSLVDVDWLGRHAQLGATFVEAASKAQVALALLGFVANVFQDLSLRKIYVRTTPTTHATLPVEFRDILVEEGRLTDHEFRDGRYVDHLIAAVYRETVCGT